MKMVRLCLLLLLLLLLPRLRLKMIYLSQFSCSTICFLVAEVERFDEQRERKREREQKVRRETRFIY